MLEIPESKTIADQLNKTVKGKSIRRVMAAHSPHGFAFFMGDPGDYPEMLEGKTLRNTAAQSGMVEIEADNMRMLFGDGVNIRYYEEGSKLPEKHQFFMELSDGSAIVCTIQMYGGIWVFEKGKNDNPYYLTAKEKPNPLTEAFGEAYFLSLFDDVKPSLSAKAFLATEQRIPGLGNGVLQDILFNAGIHPKNKISTLSGKDRSRLFKTLKKTLKSMADKGGRNTEKDLFGKSGGYKTILSNKTLKDPCPVCGAVIVRQAFLGGNIYFCPICQPLKK